MSAQEPGPKDDVIASQASLARAIMAGRIDFLYRLGRFYLFFPFAALSMAVTLFENSGPRWLAVIPLLLMICSTVAFFRLTRAYDARPAGDDPHIWARRYTILSGISGAFWGVGAVVWFVPGSFPAQAYLALAFLGMTATDFIARAAYRPAYLVHASFSLLPLAAMLLIDGQSFAELTAVLVLFFGGVLYSYCEGFAKLIDEGTRLRLDNASLINRLSQEKAEAEKARDEAQASTKAKSFFISNISHEIRTPLNALLGMAQLLEQSPLEHAQRNHVRVILEAGRGLKMLLEDVIALSREARDEALVDQAECDADNAVRTVVRLLQPRAWEKKLRLNVTTAPALPPVAGDPRRVRQVLLKLIENGLKFTETGGVDISIGSETDEGGKRLVRFAIADTGHGIPANVEKNLFEPFSAGDASYRRRHQGAGLGLAAAKRIVESLGGKIGCLSAPGEGATFWFTLPVPANIQEPQPGDGKTEAPSGLKLLVFSTGREIREEIVNLLEPFGNRLIFAGTSAEAAMRSGRETFDAIIADASDADMLGAIPGQKTPILALMTGGERAPVCAQTVLHWPAKPDAIYRALEEITQRADETAPRESETGKPPSIDPAEFAALEKSLGLPTLIEILQSYIATAESLCTALDRASEEAHWDEAARLAQDVAGTAGGLGLTALTTMARGLAQKTREGADATSLQQAAHEVIEEHRRVRQALANLYPDLAA